MNNANRHAFNISCDQCLCSIYPSHHVIRRLQSGKKGIHWIQSEFTVFGDTDHIYTLPEQLMNWSFLLHYLQMSFKKRVGVGETGGRESRSAFVFFSIWDYVTKWSPACNQLFFLPYLLHFLAEPFASISERSFRDNLVIITNSALDAAGIKRWKLPKVHCCTTNPYLWPPVLRWKCKRRDI